jgi:hypothetical protein
MESRTIASLTWRLDHGILALTDRHVVICDESGMTTDVDVARLLGAVERAGAKMIVVGDDRQLDAVGPGGALTALCERHPDHVWALTDNLRQTRPGERAALAELRDGDVAGAVGWYARAGRIHPVPDRRRAVNAMVKAWAADIAAGKETLMLAYRRDNVEAPQPDRPPPLRHGRAPVRSGADRTGRASLSGRGSGHHYGSRTARRLGDLAGRPGHRRRHRHPTVDRGHP